MERTDSEMSARPRLLATNNSQVPTLASLIAAWCVENLRKEFHPQQTGVVPAALGPLGCPQGNIVEIAAQGGARSSQGSAT
jgi:hypothetical protein